MSKTLALDDFLGHETKSGGSSQFLRGWRKRSPAHVNVFLHRGSSIVALWQHNVPRVYEKKLDGGVTQRRVFGGSWNCLESEDVLKKQYRRERDTGERTVPPVICPVCRMMEFFRAEYQQGNISFTESLFKWEGDDPKETQLLTFGGMCNLYGSDKLEDEEKKAMALASISMKEAWKENVYAKCNYLFVVVDADNPNDGVQLAIETTSLGDHVKECIRNQMTSMGEEDGNPILKPYALRWEHNANATEFSKKYKCIAMPKLAMTKEVELLINSEPPDIAGVIKPGNITTLRASLEGHYIGPVPVDWDSIFGPAERAGFGQQEDEEEGGGEDRASSAQAAPPPATQAKAPPKVETAPTPPPSAATTPKAAGGRRKKAEAPPPPPPEPEAKAETVPCDECGFAMAADATTCPQCGAEYELEAPAAEAPAAAAPPPKATAKAGGKPKGISF